MNAYVDGRSIIIKDMSADEANALKRMIECANLPERRMFNGIKTRIGEILQYIHK